MKLLRELIDGQPFINEAISGIYETKISFDDIIPEEWEDITSIENINYYFDRIESKHDYKVYNSILKETGINTGWNNLTNEEKDELINHFAFENDTDAITYLMTKGYTLEESKNILNTNWLRHNLQINIAFQQRFNYSKLVSITYLSKTDAINNYETIKTLIDYYIKFGLLGLNYDGGAIDGIMDYIESTNSYLSNGLAESGYTLLTGTYTDFIKELKNRFVYGNYIKII